MKCDACEFETDDREQFAGHRSGHVRRGEVPKRQRVTKHECKTCGLQFETGWALGGHLKIHSPFEELKSDGAQKVRLLQERGHRCEVCGITEWCGQPAPLHLEHKDGNPTNRSKNNLQLICPNCHAQTDTYCGKNIGRPKCRRREKARFPMYRSEEYVKKQIAS